MSDFLKYALGAGAVYLLYTQMTAAPAGTSKIADLYAAANPGKTAAADTAFIAWLTTQNLTADSMMSTTDWNALVVAYTAYLKTLGSGGGSGGGGGTPPPPPSPPPPPPPPPPPATDMSLGASDFGSDAWKGRVKGALDTAAGTASPTAVNAQGRWRNVDDWAFFYQTSSIGGANSISPTLMQAIIDGTPASDDRTALILDADFVNNLVAGKQRGLSGLGRGAPMRLVPPILQMRGVGGLSLAVPKGGRPVILRRGAA